MWSTGNVPIPFVEGLPFERDRAGRIIVDEFLRVLSHPEIYAVGDCAAELHSARPATAQVAAQEGRYVAKLLNGHTDQPFRYRHSGMLAYVGGFKALVDLPQVRTKGFLGWLLWNSAYATNVLSWRNRLTGPVQWLKSKLFGRDLLTFGDTPSWRHHDARAQTRGTRP